MILDLFFHLGSFSSKGEVPDAPCCEQVREGQNSRAERTRGKKPKCSGLCVELSRSSYWERELNEWKCQMKCALIPDGLVQFVPSATSHTLPACSPEELSGLAAGQAHL